MEGIVLVLALAVIVEGLVQYAKEIGKAIGAKEWKVALTQGCALVIGIVLCLLTGADLFSVVGIQFLWPVAGTVLTGIIISRGANYVSDLIKRIQK